MKKAGQLARTENYHVGFDALPASAVVLDRHGTIVDTNAAWRLSERLEQATDGTTGIGVNYLDVSDRARSTDPLAGDISDALRGILAGTRSTFEVEYAAHSPIGDRWFAMRASAAPVDEGAGVVVVHLDITFQKVLENNGLLTGSRSAATQTGGISDEATPLDALDSALSVAHNPNGVGVVLASVEGFEDIVAECGETVGRDALAHLVGRASRVLRHNDALLPMGRGEMLLVLPGLDEANLTNVSERLAEVLSAPVQLGAQEFTFAIGLGSCTAGPDTTAASTLADLRKSITHKNRRTGATSLRRDPVLPSPRAQPATTTAATSTQRLLADAVGLQAKLLEAVGQPIIATDPDSLVLFWNKAAERTYGWTEAEALGKPLSTILPPPKYWTDNVEQIKANQLQGESWTSECEIVTKSGAIIAVSITASPVLDDEGNLLATIGVSQDLTERNRADEATAHLSRLSNPRATPSTQFPLMRQSSRAIRLPSGFSDSTPMR